MDTYTIDSVTTIGRSNGAMLVLLDLSAAFDTIHNDNIFSSKRHSLQAVELSRWLQTAVQIVSKPPTSSNGGPIYLFWGKTAMRTRWMASAAPHKSG